MKYRCLAVFTACLLLLAACGRKAEETTIANPWQDAKDFVEAQEKAGFSMMAPERIDGCPEIAYRVNTTEGSRILEIRYTSHDEIEACIRKGEGTADISGDYNSYDSETTMDVGDASVRIRGNGGAVKLATWTSDGYSYSVYVSTGLSLESMTSLIQSVS